MTLQPRLEAAEGCQVGGRWLRTCVRWGNCRHMDALHPGAEELAGCSLPRR